jgi:hypothetical protein
MSSNDEIFPDGLIFTIQSSRQVTFARFVLNLSLGQ